MEQVTAALKAASLEKYAAALEDEGWEDMSVLKKEGAEGRATIAKDVGMSEEEAKRFLAIFEPPPVEPIAKPEPPVDVSEPTTTMPPAPAPVAAPAPVEPPVAAPATAQAQAGGDPLVGKMASFLASYKLEHLWEVEGIQQLSDEQTDEIMRAKKDDNVKYLATLGVKSLKDRQAFAAAVLKSKRAREAAAIEAVKDNASPAVKFMVKRELFDLIEFLKEMPDAEFNEIVDSVKSLKEDRRQKAAKIMIDPPYGLKSLLAMRFINQVSLEYLGEGM